MKAEGWEFASHTWGHKDVAATSLDDLKRDDKKWKKYVAPILGETDMIIFAFGADIGSWEGYSADNEKYEFYKSQGYRYFCNVDSSQYFVQITDDYFRQGRRNLDGYRMYYNPEMLSDLFDVSEVRGFFKTNSGTWNVEGSIDYYEEKNISCHACSLFCIDSICVW